MSLNPTPYSQRDVARMDEILYYLSQRWLKTRALLTRERRDENQSIRAVFPRVCYCTIRLLG